MNVIKPIISFLIIVIISSLLVIFDKKTQLKKIYKQLIYGVVFGAIAVGCNFLLVDKYLGLANSAIIVGGIVFGGPIGIIAGIIGTSERLFAMLYGSLEVTRISVPVILILSGALSYFIRDFVITGKKVRWYYGFVIGAIIEGTSILLMFLVHLSNTDAAYLIIKKYGLINVLVNSIAVGITLGIVRFLPKEESDFKIEKIGIQTKTQLSLWLILIVGLTAATNISYSVLKNNSKSEREKTIKLAIDDVERNTSSDVDNDFSILIQKIISEEKANGKTIYTPETFEPEKDRYSTFEEYRSYFLKNYLKQYKTKILFSYITQPTDLTIVHKSGTIFASTDEYISGLSNISEFNIEHLEMLEKYSLINAKSLVSDFEFNEQKNEKLKIVQKQYNNNYYFLLTFDEKAFHKQMVHSFEKSISKRHFGNNGYLVVTDNTNTIVSSPAEGPKGSLDFSVLNRNEFLISTVENVDYYTYIDEYIEFNIIAIINKQESDDSVAQALKATILSELAIFLVIYLFIYLAISSSVIIPLKRVNKTLNVITEGNLDEKVTEYSSNELQTLSNDINSTVDSLKEYMGREAKLIKKDLDFAQSIQTSVLPKLTKEYSENSSFDIFASMNAAKEVGGDFYDFQLLDDKHLFILIADVSGKGVPAAMFMMQSKTIIKTLVENSSHIDEAITKANAKLCESNAAGMFVTCWCAVINLETGVMEYVNAGHNPPLIKKNNGEFVYLSAKPSFVLAGLDFFKYSSSIIQFEKGDQLFLYTDGVTEAYSVNDELFGENRLLECAKNITTNKSSEFCEIILKNVREYAEGKEQSDDITMLHFMYRGFSK